ncbi:hypothetical protein [Streptomyces zagrosensis]|uniref:Lipoprotein n=1 Tax=Streptomyces zagrosensis TaxID=1042984 RepID=A0A7W9Q9K7_9ACTN|nr:hypothetical protein [Streptomyces zagrosensis]MBB5936066.1 hypothetical protein [Streptomyces zagrosensis]
MAAAIGSVLLCGGVAGCGSSEPGAEERPERAAPSAPTSAPQVAPATAVREAARKGEAFTTVHYRTLAQTPKDGLVTSDVTMTAAPFSLSVTHYAPGEPGEPGENTGIEATAETPILGEMRIVDGATYVKGDAETTAKLGDTPWMKLDVSAPRKDGTSEPDLGRLKGRTPKNPAIGASFLAESHDLRRAGTETIMGVSTTHYRGTLSTTELRKNSATTKDPARRASREEAIEEFEKTGAKRFSTDMWIDPDGFTKQFTMSATTPDGPVAMELTFLAHNEGFSIDPPPADQITHESDHSGQSNG